MEPFLLEINDADHATPDGAGSPDERHVQVRGEVDMSSSTQLAAHLDGLIAAGASRLVIDATEISFLDSTGLRVLVDAAGRLEAAGGSLTVEPMSASVRRVLEMTGLLDRYGAS